MEHLLDEFRAAADRDCTLDEINTLVAQARAWIDTNLHGSLTQSWHQEDIGGQYNTPLRRTVIEYEWGSCSAQEVAAAGLSFEVAGPTHRHPQANVLPDVQVDFLSNLYDPGTSLRYPHDVDLQADGAYLPLRSACLGSVHVSYLPGASRHRDADKYASLRDDTILESVRVLRPRGILVWDGGTIEDFETITKIGLRPRKLLIQNSYLEEWVQGKGWVYPGIHLTVHGVYQKPAV